MENKKQPPPTSQSGKYGGRAPQYTKDYLLQNTIEIHIVENLLSDQAIFQNFFLLEPDRNFFLRLFRRTGSMNQIADRTLIRPAGYFSHDTDSLMAFPYHSHHRSG